MGYIYKDIEESDDLSLAINNVSNNIKMINSMIKELKNLRMSAFSEENNKTCCDKALIEEEKVVIEEVDEFKDEVEYYYSLIKNIDFDSDVVLKLKNILPSVSYSKFDDIILGINSLFMRDINEIRDFIESNKDTFSIDELKEFKDDILSISNKISVIRCIKEVLLERNILDEDIVKKNRLVFLETNSGNVYTMDDLDNNSVPNNYYEGFLELIKSIENNSFKNFKFIDSNNSELAGISEVKGFQKRVIFDRVGADTYVIIGAFIKKTDNDKRYRDFFSNRVGVYFKNKDYILKMIQNEDYLEKHKKILEDIYEFLDSTRKKKGM